MVVNLFNTALLALAVQQPSAAGSTTRPEHAQQNASLQLEVRRVADDQLLNSESTVYQGELLHLDLTISFTPEFHDKQLINPWRMPLELPVELQLPWGNENDAWQVSQVVDIDVATETSAGNGNERSLVINRARSTARSLQPSRDGRLRYLVRRAIHITDDQAFELPAATMKVVWATTFEDDLARGKVPLDRQEALVSSPGTILKAVPLPEHGRPESFRGAVGQFEMRMESELRVDEELEAAGQASEQEATVPATDSELIWDIRIHVGGRGWLSKESLPRLERLESFHLRGQRSEITAGGYTLIAELSTTDPKLLPTLPTWSYFDPSSPAAYKTLGAETAVGGQAHHDAGQDSSAQDANAAAETTGINEADAPVATEKFHLQLYWLGIGAFFFIFGMLHLMRRRPQVSVAKSQVTSPPAVSRPSDFLQQLADRLGCRREQVYTADLSEILKRSDLPEVTRERILDAVSRIVHARFGGQGNMPPEQEIRSILKEIQR
ncbi:MAG: hypothetical protein QF489_01920 [Planctomycetota bacterium]|jgi:hypothetical protein|nr:hypothetical protein [Planctomycetota bacterium]